MNEALKITDLSVDYATPYGRKPAVREVTLALTEGRILGIVGESGSGKSTLLHAIARLLPAAATITTGTIECLGTRIDVMTPREFAPFRGRIISAMVQDAGSGLHPLMTIGAQIDETLRYIAPETTSGQSSAADLMKRVGLDPALADRHPHRLSGGQRQRVGLALALVGAPKILLADEPTASLDNIARLEFAELLRDVVRTAGIAAMLVSHDIGLIGAVADDIAVVLDGRVVERGSVGGILQAPQHSYTQTLITASARVRAA